MGCPDFGDRSIQLYHWIPKVNLFSRSSKKDGIAQSLSLERKFLTQDYNLNEEDEIIAFMGVIYMQRQEKSLS